jgi:hypothetical protein
MTVTEGGVTDDADRFGLIQEFNLYFAVRTLEAVNGSNAIYTQRAAASWKFDACGPVVGGIWTPTGTGVTGSASFGEVTSGIVVPVTTGQPINDLQEGTWNMIDQP